MLAVDALFSRIRGGSSDTGSRAWKRFSKSGQHHPTCLLKLGKLKNKTRSSCATRWHERELWLTFTKLGWHISRSRSESIDPLEKMRTYSSEIRLRHWFLSQSFHEETTWLLTVSRNSLVFSFVCSYRLWRVALDLDLIAKMPRARMIKHLRNATLIMNKPCGKAKTLSLQGRTLTSYGLAIRGESCWTAARWRSPTLNILT